MAAGLHTADIVRTTLTHQISVVNYAFAAIGPDLNITASDAEIDYTNFKKLRTLKAKFTNLKTVISVGGWEDSGRFSTPP